MTTARAHLPNKHGLGTARIALCHEWLTTYGGSELVAARIADSLGIEDVYVFTKQEELARRLFGNRRVTEAHRWGQTGLVRDHWRWFLPAMPHAWKSLDLSAYDVVITSSHACVNAVRVRPDALHISYCHTPMRYAWEWRGEIRRIPAPLRTLWPSVAAGFRAADRRWASRVGCFIANSHHVAQRIEHAYGKPSLVIYPPVDTSYWTPSDHDQKEDFFLFAGRLVPYKRADVAVAAADLAGVRLVVAGSGPELARLEKIAGSNVDFVSNPSKRALRDLYRRAKALVFPGVEDFGMTFIESQACGTPVIALKEGGALEAIQNGRTGLLYKDASPEGLANAMSRFDPTVFSIPDLRRHAEQFSDRRFDASIRRAVDELLEEDPANQRATETWQTLTSSSRSTRPTLV